MKILFLSDMHNGCKMAVCPPSVPLDEGGEYLAGWWQLGLLEYFDECMEAAKSGIGNDPFYIVFCGDLVENLHHRNRTPFSINIYDHMTCAEMMMKRTIDHFDYDQLRGTFFLQGTEAHTGGLHLYEKLLARQLADVLKVVKNPVSGGLTRRHIYLRDPDNGAILHATHHMSIRNIYESHAIEREWMLSVKDAVRWENPAPDFIVRGHCHRWSSIDIGSAKTKTQGFTMPGWQGKTPYVDKTIGGRAAMACFGIAWTAINSNGLTYVDRIYEPITDDAQIEELAS